MKTYKRHTNVSLLLTLHELPALLTYLFVTLNPGTAG